MCRSFNIKQNPYDNGKLYLKSQITLNPGMTILVGCNGSGKTTLLYTIRDVLKSENVPVLMYDNLHEGGNKAMNAAINVSHDLTLLATLATSSEGEQIYTNFANKCESIGRFVRKHKNKKEIWIMLDALDSGFSIDNIVEIKDFLTNMVIGGNKHMDVYILISANEYELCRGENCFDVREGKYIEFNDYEDYRSFIIKSRELKDLRSK